MLTNDYTQAAFELIRQGKDVNEVIRGLTATLKRRGHSVLLPAVLSKMLRKAERMTQDLHAEVRVARKDDATALKSRIEEMIAKLGGTKDMKLVVDETLIGGAVVKHKGTSIDASHKAQLLTVYRALTSSSQNTSSVHGENECDMKQVSSADDTSARKNTGFRPYNAPSS